MYTRDKAVIQCGYYADPPSTPEDKAKVNRINDFWKPFYFRWVETFLAKGEQEELVPLKHFLHRFTRSIFWEIEDMIPFSNHPIYRCLWGWLGAPEVPPRAPPWPLSPPLLTPHPCSPITPAALQVSLLKLFQGPVIRKASCYAHVVQESIMPLHKLVEGIDRFDEWFGVYPLLVFPVRVVDRGPLSGMLRPNPKELEKGKNYGIWVDLGAYGVPQLIKEGKTWDAKANVRAMEHWTRENNGWCAVYTDIFCTQKEFRLMFDHTLLDKCRARLNCAGAFPEVYAKVKPEAGIADLSDELDAEAKAEKNGSNGWFGRRPSTSPAGVRTGDSPMQ
jgi:delta24-sterol reductase